jgi:hypothetical protein
LGYYSILFYGKVQITAVIMLKFFGTNGIPLVLFLAILWITFPALCVPTVLSVGSDSGWKKLELPL